MSTHDSTPPDRSSLSSSSTMAPASSPPVLSSLTGSGSLPLSGGTCRISPSDIELQNEIGSGAFGTVYRGVCRRHTPVAIKVLDQDDANRDKLLKELEILQYVSSCRPYTAPFPTTR